MFASGYVFSLADYQNQLHFGSLRALISSPVTAKNQTENCSAISLFALQIYGAAVADNLDKNRGVLNRRYFRQVRLLSFFQVCDIAGTHDFG